MKTLFSFILLLSTTSYGKELTIDELNAKTFQAVDHVVGAGDTPQKCIVNYSISSSSESKPPSVEDNQATRGRRLAIALQEIKHAKGNLNPAKLDEIVAKADNEAAWKTQQTRYHTQAILEYKENGVLKQKTLLDTDKDWAEFAVLNENMTTVISNFAERYCPISRTTTMEKRIKTYSARMPVRSIRLEGFGD